MLGSNWWESATPSVNRIEVPAPRKKQTSEQTDKSEEKSFLERTQTYSSNLFTLRSDCKRNNGGLNLNVTTRRVQMILWTALCLKYCIGRAASVAKAAHKLKHFSWTKEILERNSSFWREAIFTDEKKIIFLFSLFRLQLARSS